MSEWWRNIEVDDEAREIDRRYAERQIPDGNVLAIRRLITQFEACHHKAGRWLELIIDAIGAGSVQRQPGQRALPGMHPAEQDWRKACDVLEAWLKDEPGRVAGVKVGVIGAEALVAALGARTALKVWQVQRVVQRARSFWDPSCGYEAISGEDPQDEGFLAQTRTVRIHNRVDGQMRELSLAVAIDMLMPCHWNFAGNLRVVLQAIGGELYPAEPFAACGYNSQLSPLRERARMVAEALEGFCGTASEAVSLEVVRRLGEPTPERQWLAASLAKTLRAQLCL